MSALMALMALIILHITVLFSRDAGHQTHRHDGHVN
jgi:hypothetical protein